MKNDLMTQIKYFGHNSGLFYSTSKFFKETVDKLIRYEAARRGFKDKEVSLKNKALFEFFAKRHKHALRSVAQVREYSNFSNGSILFDMGSTFNHSYEFNCDVTVLCDALICWATREVQEGEEFFYAQVK
jgi:hypothetical protein